ncbi:PRC-barrel domain-containing protein [Streptomyces sp. SCSIO 30461]|uniref:PRC-barrel domain-containing protein n=1 Tax=Streptomyces sp. SCSIO 30461 TaxID=3118085 RepID=UPI0030CC3D71
MTGCHRASEIVRKPVVTLGGDDIAQIKDIVLDDRGTVRCFTLSGRGVLAGPIKRVLPWSEVHALGPDAVMIRVEDALEDADSAEAAVGQGGGDVLGARMMTEDGTDLGRVTDVVIEAGETAQVVGYEVDSRAKEGRLLLPVIGTLAASAEMVVVPRATAEFAAGDLGSLPAAVEALRNRLAQET